MVYFRGKKSIIKLDWGDGQTPCEYIKRHQCVHYEWVSYMICRVYLNKEGFFKINGGLNYCGIHVDCEKWCESVYILKAEWEGFSDILWVAWEKART